MARSANDRARAFHLYCAGVPQERIAQAIGAGIATIARWIKKYDWKNEKEKLMPLVRESDKNDKEKLNEDLLRSIKKVWAEMVKEGTAKAGAHDVIETIKLERLMGGESTENINVTAEIVDDFDELYKEARRIHAAKKPVASNNDDAKND